jgi:hypothetical protein
MPRRHRGRTDQRAVSHSRDIAAETLRKNIFHIRYLEFCGSNATADDVHELDRLLLGYTHLLELRLSNEGSIAYADQSTLVYGF